jgi:Ca2+-binding EF-hand superfamily protein
MKFYDVDGDGHVSYEEFINGLREPLSARKQKAIDFAFKLLDLDGKG